MPVTPLSYEEARWRLRIPKYVNVLFINFYRFAIVLKMAKFFAILPIWVFVTDDGKKDLIVNHPLQTKNFADATI